MDLIKQYLDPRATHRPGTHLTVQVIDDDLSRAIVTLWMGRPSPDAPVHVEAHELSLREIGGLFDGAAELAAAPLASVPDSDLQQAAKGYDLADAYIVLDGQPVVGLGVDDGHIVIEPAVAPDEP